MFYVYDLDGLRFRGPMEALERERKVERRAPVQPLKGGARTTPFPEEGGRPARTSHISYPCPRPDPLLPDVDRVARCCDSFRCVALRWCALRSNIV